MHIALSQFQKWNFRVLAIAAALVAGLTSSADGATAAKIKKHHVMTAHAGIQSACAGAFSDGSSINVAQPAYLNDVPGDQLFCDFHTFAWNQFIYMTQMQPDPNDGGAVTPLFMHQAPWYNLLTPNGSPAPGPFPGGSTSLSAAGLDQGQAGDDDHLVDVRGSTVLYDIRFNAAMYNAILGGGLNTQAGFQSACTPGAGGNCANPLWLPPGNSAVLLSAGALEIKTSWRDFGNAAACPAATFYCNGRFALVGIHLVQKTQTHGEWIWASFEHVANDPDCSPGGDTPISQNSPLGTPWSFFNPATAGPGVMGSQTCSVGGAPQCNADPKYYLSSKIVLYKPVNICRTQSLPPGGVSAANCAVVPDGPPQPQSNSPGNVACLNAKFQPLMNGVWKNYKLIGSLWIRGSTGPTQDFRIQVFQNQQPGLPYKEAIGFPHLANTTMETWLQPGSTGYDPKHNNATQAGCFFCHNLPSAFTVQEPTDHRSDDFSHYPGKLPQEKLKALLRNLLSAYSTQKAKN